MAFDQQQTPVKSTRALVQFPALPAIKATPAEWEQWYFSLRTSVQNTFNGLAEEIDRLKAKG